LLVAVVLLDILLAVLVVMVDLEDFMELLARVERTLVME
jgi:hypothetical protein